MIIVFNKLELIMVKTINVRKLVKFKFIIALLFLFSIIYKKKKKILLTEIY